ncbi:MAG: ATP-grasp domain-containing protein [bacterium]|nr:ATP-grasp domain-containing protein [bacterium]
MSTLILPPRYTEDSIALWRTASKCGWKPQRVHGWRLNSPVTDDEIAIYGEALFVSAIAEQSSLKMIEPPFDWLSKLPMEFTKRDISFGTIGDLESISYPAFVKPADDKCFPAGVYNSFSEIPVLQHLEPNIYILVSQPVKWEIEFRNFIREKKCMTSSVYCRNGEIANSKDGNWATTERERKEAEAFLQEFLNSEKITLPPSVVVDTGFITGKGWAVIEANPSWGSGVYGCDTDSVLKTISRGCIPEAKLTDSDSKWIIEREIPVTEA